MKTKSSKLYSFLSILVFLAMIVGISVPTFKAQATGATVLVDTLQPSWGVPGDGGGGVFSAYVGPVGYGYVSPGVTALYDGREAGIIKAGINIDPTSGHFEDEGFFGFIPNVTIDTLSAGVMSYDVETQAGLNPVWMTIEIDTGVPGDRADNTTYQFVPTTNPAGWHTVNAAAGLWQKWNNSDGDVTGNPKISLSAVATAQHGFNVIRAYLRLGMGDSYSNSGTGTIAWVDKAILGGVTYDFIQQKYWYVDPSGSDSLNKGSLASPFQTIQHAIDASGPGDTIHVAAGTYIENVVVGKSVTIAGAGTQTIVKPAITNPNCGGSGGGSLCSGASNIILVQADNVIIHDLTLDGDNPSLAGGVNKGGANIDARNGIITNHGLGVYNALEVYNVTIRNIYLRGMYASSGGSFNFHDNTVTNVQADPGGASIAIFAYGGGPGIMEHNTVSYASDAISANHSKGIQFLNNTVTHSGSGVHTDNAGDGGGVADLIQGNNVDCTGTPGAYGVWVFVPYLAPTVNNNTVINCSTALSAWGQGAAVTPQFTNNTATGDGSADSAGIYITTDLISWGYSDVNVNFTGNTISGFGYGIELEAGAHPAWGTNPQPFSAQTITAGFANNQIFGNTVGLAEQVDSNPGGTYTVTATPNWWGAASGPSNTGANRIIPTDVPTTPWCVEAGCIDQLPGLPANFYGFIHFLTGAPSVGALVDAYVPGVSGAVGSAHIISDPGTGFLAYQMDIPGNRGNTSIKNGGQENDAITFQIGSMVVGTGIWHSGTNTELDIHPPIVAAGPFSGIARSPITLTGAANDWLTTDTFTYAWDLDNNGTYETSGSSFDYTWDHVGTKTVGLKVTDSLGVSGTGLVTVNVNPIQVTVNLSNLDQAYDGLAKPVTVDTIPAGHTVSVTYNTSATVPTEAGSYDVLATVTDADFTGSTSGTLHISQATSSVTVTCPPTAQTYTGSAIEPCTASYSGIGGLSGSLTPTYLNNVHVGTATATATYAGDTNHTGSSNSTTFEISRATATINLSNLTPVFDGNPKIPTVVTSPVGLAYSLTYNGSPTAPSAVGIYTVVATITDPNYTGTTTASLDIQATHSIALVPGWNLVSFNLVPLDTSTATVLSSIAGKYDLVYGWDASGGHGSSGNWMKFAPGGPGYANSLNNMDQTMGFWIHATTNTTLDVVGNAPTTTNINLATVTGWNLVGYASSVNGNLPAILRDHGVGDNFSLVYAYHANDTADLWKLFDRTAPDFASDLKFLSPGWGYWIKVSVDHTWSVGY